MPGTIPIYTDYIDALPDAASAAPKSAFAPGDVVKLRSGSAQFVITSVIGVDRVEIVAWSTVRNEFTTHILPTACLEHVEKA